MTLLHALEFSKALAKHSPFVRMQPEEQKLANIAGPMLSKAANTEELQDLMKREDMKVRNFVANAEERFVLKGLV